MASMAHPLVTQLRFTRRELVRCTNGVTAEEAVQRLGQMNCLSWIVGHVAAQEHFLWLELAQGVSLAPGIYELVGFGQPPSTPPWEEMWDLWRRVTGRADHYLDTLTPAMLTTRFPPHEMYANGEDIGTLLLRCIYHYWFHTGEAHAIRQMLGHKDLPQFVGDMSAVVHSLQ